MRSVEVRRSAALRLLGAAAFVFVAASCATVPTEATTLSSELGGRIQESKILHENTVRLFMTEKRAAVDRFLDTEWLPEYARNSFGSPAVQAVWEQAVKTTDPKERLQVITGLATRLQSRVNKQRTEMMQPLDAIEQSLIQQLEEHYSEMLAMNSTLTGLLGSAAKSSETQAKILSGLHLQQQLSTSLSKADEIVKLMTQGTDALQKNQGRIEEVLKSVKSKL